MKIPKHMLAMTAIFKLNCDSIESSNDTQVGSHSILFSQTFNRTTRFNILNAYCYLQGIRFDVYVHNAATVHSVFWMKRHAVFVDFFSHSLFLFVRLCVCVRVYCRFAIRKHVRSRLPNADSCVYVWFNLLMGYFIRIYQNLHTHTHKSGMVTAVLRFVHSRSSVFKRKAIICNVRTTSDGHM